MARLVPAIHADVQGIGAWKKRDRSRRNRRRESTGCRSRADVDDRDEPGHDGIGVETPPSSGVTTLQKMTPKGLFSLDTKLKSREPPTARRRWENRPRAALWTRRPGVIRRTGPSASAAGPRGRNSKSAGKSSLALAGDGLDPGRRHRAKDARPSDRPRRRIGGFARVRALKGRRQAAAPTLPGKAGEGLHALLHSPSPRRSGSRPKSARGAKPRVGSSDTDCGRPRPPRSRRSPMS